MILKHGKGKFGIYYWDTFDNETIFVHETDSLEKAISFVEDKYKDRIKENGADQVDIVNDMGDVVKQFNVG